MSDAVLDPLPLLRPRRRITGMSAILLPFASDGSADWPAFRAHVARTAAAGLTCPTTRPTKAPPPAS